MRCVQLTLTAVASALAFGLCLPAGAAAMTNYQAAVLADNPAVYYTFDELEGDVAQNYGLLGEALDGFYMNGVGLGLPSPYPAEMGTAAAFGRAHPQGETPCWVSIKGEPELNVGTGDFSIEMWFRSDAIEQSPLFNNRSSDAFDFSISVKGGADNVLGGLLWVRDHTPESELLSWTAVWENQWHHLVLARTAGYYDLFIDGVKTHLGAKEYITMPPYPEIPITDFNEEYSVEKRIGSLFNEAGEEFYFHGLIDEFALYGAALSERQVGAHYAAATGVPEPGALALLAAGLVAAAAYAWGKQKFGIC